MHTAHLNCKDNTLATMATLATKKRMAQMKLDLEASLCENENSASNCSSSNSSIIDPGDENYISYDEELYDRPAKKMCTEFSKRWPGGELGGGKQSTRSPSASSTHSSASPPPPPQPQPPTSASPDKSKPSRSFLIKDILSGSSKNDTASATAPTPTTAPGTMAEPNKPDGASFMRPWDIESNPSNYLNQLNQAASLFQSIHSYNALAGLHPSSLSLFHNAYANTMKNYRVMPNRRPRSADDDSRSDRSESPESPASASANAVSSPLDALFEMTSKAFDRNENSDKTSDPTSDHLNMFNNRASQIKKKRKSRTAFTNHQIFELEKRFLYQKYLSPADRDEIAQSLGLTNAQVITWFQNRRAKLKRDVEELKKDVDAAKISNVHNALLDNIQDLSLLKKNEIVAALHQHAQHSGN